MSERIEVGDLVAVVRVCCSNSKALGLVRTVTGFLDGSVSACSVCHTAPSRGTPAATLGIDPADGRIWLVPLSWLKKIPPLKELERIEEKETA